MNAIHANHYYSAKQRFAAKHERDTEKKEKNSLRTSAALCVLRGKKTFNAEDAEECAEDAEKKIPSVSLCLGGSLFQAIRPRSPGAEAG